MILYLYWATRKGNPTWAEELILESEKKLNLSKLRKIMRKHGYDRVRETTYKLSEKYISEGKSFVRFFEFDSDEINEILEN